MVTRLSKTSPKRQSPRVESWVYEVINPLLEIVPIELSFLQRGNVTFRFFNNTLEFIRSIENHLSLSARHICRDFMKANLDAAKCLSKHDKLVNTLNLAARAAFTALSSNPEFVAKVNYTLAEYQLGQKEYPGGAYPEEKFLHLVAEHVVNRIESLPDHFTDFVFWTRYGKEFLKFRKGCEVDKVDNARYTLLEFDKALIDWLQEKSYKLCTQYDIPAAPTQSVYRSHEQL
ncbi:MAG: hypothetical protein Q6358_10585 [Candidatus Brocadiales bacterium]|nr:hypothetical protein [Candidatus Brocadiales bacterium]